MICYKCTKEVIPDKAFSGLHSQCFVQWFGLEKPESFSEVIRRQQGSEEQNAHGEWSDLISSFYQGKFKKYSAKLQNKSYLLKVQEKEYPELPAMEYLCNQVAEQLRLKIPAFALIMFENVLPTFVCENFMQYYHSSNLIHIYHFLTGRQDYNCEKIYQIILEKTGRLQEAYRFVELTLYDALLGNHDRHGRNIALIQSPKGYKLSPFYDNPCYLGLEDELLLAAQHEPRGKVATAETIDPTLKDYVREWRRLNCDDLVFAFWQKMAIEKIFYLIDRSYISDGRKEALKRLVERRYREFQNELIG